MSSLIPKIKVGTKKQRDKMDLSFDNSTTLGFGHVQPTMCREMVPGSTFEVKTNSFVRLSPLVLPTFGRMSLKHKHVFVPISSIWEPFNSFLAGQPYSFNGQSVKWNKTPYFQLSRVVARIISNYSNISIYVKNPNPTEGDDYIPIGLTPVEVTQRNVDDDVVISGDAPYQTSTIDLEAYQNACKDVYNTAREKMLNGDFGTPNSTEATVAQSAWYVEHLPDSKLFTTYEDHNVNVTYTRDQIIAYNSLLSGFSPDISGVQQAWTDLVVGQKSVFDVVGAPLLGMATAQNPTGVANDGLGTILLGGYYIEASSSSALLSVRTESNLVGNIIPITAGIGQVSDMAESELGYVDYRNCDYFTEYTVSGTGRTYGIAFKLKPVARRLRSIFIGLGYQFSPFDTLEFSPFKLFAFYKAWFELFRPKREYAFSDTACYKLMMDCRDISKINITTSQATNWDAFMLELAEAYFYLPQDYFGMSTVRPAEQFTASVDSNSDAKFIKLGSFDGSVVDASQNGIPTERYTVGLKSGVTPTSTVYTSDPTVSVPVRDRLSGGNVVSRDVSALSIQMAMRLLKFANKNTIVGRSIHDYIKAHFGISIDDADGTGQIIFIGDDDIQIQVSDVMSTAQTEQAYIGEYAGRGVGYGSSKDYTFTAKEFGYWITLSCIVPKSGYFQGYLRENRHLERLDFFTPEFDALGYQILERGEVMDDYTHKFANFNPIDGYGFTRNAGFGFVPRYSEYKTGRNIVNGDLSLNSIDASMSAYYLDRKFPRFDGSAISYESSDGTVHPIFQLTAPSFKPSVVFDNFRRIDPSDRLGDYGRIFRYDALARDPFIIHSIFNVKAVLPAKSLSKSFDTTEADDTDVIEIAHA